MSATPLLDKALELMDDVDNGATGAWVSERMLRALRRDVLHEAAAKFRLFDDFEFNAEAVAVSLIEMADEQEEQP